VHRRDAADGLKSEWKLLLGLRVKHEKLFFAGKNAGFQLCDLTIGHILQLQTPRQHACCLADTGINGGDEEQAQVGEDEASVAAQLRHGGSAVLEVPGQSVRPWPCKWWREE
jgi:hypothetical protein